MSYFHLGREVDDPEHLRIERYLIAKRAGRYNRPPKVNDEYLIQTPPSQEQRKRRTDWTPAKSSWMV